MKTIFSITILLFLFSACTKNRVLERSEIPSCIQDLIEEDSEIKSIKTVKSQELNGVNHYWINTDAMHFDGIEIIISSSCDTLCLFCGECLLPPCVNEYTNEWVNIWEQ